MSSMAAVPAERPEHHHLATAGADLTVRSRRTLLVGTRLALAANTTFNFAMLFSLLYLRLNNFNGGFKPDGVEAPDLGVGLITIALQVVSMFAALAALGAVRRGAGAAKGMLAVSLLFGIASVVARIYQEYHLGVGSELHKSTYSATAAMWFAILVFEVILGCLWLVFLLGSGRASDRGGPERSTAGELITEATVAVTQRHLRAFAEFWVYLTVLSTAVFLLIHFT